MYHIIFALLFTVYIITNTGRYIAFDADWKCTCVVAILPVTLGRRRGEEVEMWTLVVGVTVAMRGGMSGAILVGRTAAVGVLSPENGFVS